MIITEMFFLRFWHIELYNSKISNSCKFIDDNFRCITYNRLCHNILTKKELERFSSFNNWRTSMEKRADVFDVEISEVQNMTCSKVRDMSPMICDQ